MCAKDMQIEAVFFSSKITSSFSCVYLFPLCVYSIDLLLKRVMHCDRAISTKFSFLPGCSVSHIICPLQTCGYTLKNKSHPDANFVVTGGTTGCRFRQPVVPPMATKLASWRLVFSAAKHYVPGGIVCGQLGCPSSPSIWTTWMHFHNEAMTRPWAPLLLNGHPCGDWVAYTKCLLEPNYHCKCY